MPLSISIEPVLPSFPDFRAAVLVVEGLTIERDRPPELEATIRAREEEARARWKGIELSQIPGIAAWRRAYKGFGIKQTRYRSSVERLLKNVLGGRELARVNAFVDLYNAVSLRHVLPLGADDLDHVIPPLAFRYAREGDNFQDMSDLTEDGEVEPEAPKVGEVVYADARKILCRRWNWRQDARSLITPHTTRAIVTLQANGWGDPEAAAADLGALIQKVCGGTCRTAFLDRSRAAAEV